MILPTNEECERVIKELDGDPGLSEWESQFVGSNVGRKQFSDRQREIIASLLEKFEV